MTGAAFCADIATPAVTLADLLSLKDDELARVSPVQMYLLTYDGFTYGGKDIDYGKIVNELLSLADFYGLAGLGANGTGEEDDRANFVALLKALEAQPPEHCPVPFWAYALSLGRLLGYPVALAQTPKGAALCMRSPRQDAFLDLDAEGGPRWWGIAEEAPQAVAPGVEQVGQIPGERPALKHWIYEPRDILGMALAERAKRVQLGYLSALPEARNGVIDKLIIENDEGKFEIDPLLWECQSLLSLISYLQATAASPRADLKRWMRIPAIVSGAGWRALAYHLPLYVGGDGGPVDPKIPRVDRATRSIRNLALEKLLEKSPREIGSMDIALLNLVCADELPGSGKIDIPAALATIDQWTEVVRYRLENNFHLYAKNPAKFDNSPNKFKAAMLVLCLQADIGVHYNKDVAAVIDPDAMAKKYPGSEIDGRLSLLELSRSKAGSGSKDQFLTGILGPEKSGTCASLPVLYAAVGRRLGFPIKLVTVPGHVFARWESLPETFNIEGTAGFSIHDDDYYRRWPTRVWPQDEKEKGYLKSLTPAEEFAMFLRQRAACLEDKGRLVEAMISTAQSCRYRNLRVDRMRILAQSALFQNESYYGK